MKIIIFISFSGTKGDAVAYTIDGQSQTNLNIFFSSWQNKYLQYAAGKVFERCGSTTSTDPDAWQIIDGQIIRKL